MYNEKIRSWFFNTEDSWQTFVESIGTNFVGWRTELAAIVMKDFTPFLQVPLVQDSRTVVWTHSGSITAAVTMWQHLQRLSMYGSSAIDGMPVVALNLEAGFVAVARYWRYCFKFVKPDDLKKIVALTLPNSLRKYWGQNTAKLAPSWRILEMNSRFKFVAGFLNMEFTQLLFLQFRILAKIWIKLLSSFVSDNLK